MIRTVKISGISCGACIKLIQKRIGAIQGVTEVNIEQNSGQTEIVSTRSLSSEEIKSSLKDTPYEVN